MNEPEIDALRYNLASLCVFRNLLQKKLFTSLMVFLDRKNDFTVRLEAYSEFVHEIQMSGLPLSDLLWKMLKEDENIYIVSSGKGKCGEDVEKNALSELGILSKLTNLSSVDLTEHLLTDTYLPVFSNHPLDFVPMYKERAANVSSFGYGIFATASMFQLDGGEIVPVKSEDKKNLDDFVGYENERALVYNNTLAFVSGKKAANVLLCGDAGTGKSSTVKACVNRFSKDGLRLIEVRKDQLLLLPKIMGEILENPLKFIIFIDDLSFNNNDDNFSMLKATLEGSASGKSDNAVIYATSNRRHIVKESFADRTDTDDVHRNDTIQELMSLSDRFGLTVYYEKPNKQLYLEIVHTLLDRAGIQYNSAEIDVRAEAFALTKASRSPRLAEQFVLSIENERT